MSAPTSFEQLQLELINRFRVDPGGEYARLVVGGTGITPDIESAIRFFGVDLDALQVQLAGLDAAAPLAWNANLATAADAHSQAQIHADQQSHQLPGEPGLGDRLRNAGYEFSAAAENVFAFTEDALQGHAGFIIDWGYDEVRGASSVSDYDASGNLLPNFASIGDGIQDPPGHRDNLINDRYTEIGIAALAETNPNTSVGPFVVTQNLGSRFDYQAQFLGVVVNDLDRDNFYDIGEGLGGVTVTLTNVSTEEIFTTTSFASGGWQLAAPSGSYSIAFSGGGLTQVIVRQAFIDDENVKVDAYQSAGTATPGNDTIIGTDDDDDIDGGAGNDTLRGGLGNDRYTVTQGDDRVVGTMEELVGDTIIDFGPGDSLFVMGQDLSRDKVQLRRGGAGLELGFDANGDGVFNTVTESPLTVISTLLTGGDVMLSRVEGGSDVRYVAFLPTLGEGARVDAGSINGIANEAYLAGDNRGNFTVTLQESDAGFDNSLGVYEVRGDGTIADVRIISRNVKDDAGEVLTIGNVDVGSRLGFFLVQDGANMLPSALDLDALGIDVSGGSAVLTAAGSAVAGATIFLSHDASLNADGQRHVLSGVDDDDTGALRVGFEDLFRVGATSDDDFQDVVFRVEAVAAVAVTAAVPLGSETFAALPQLEIIA
ncbi:DUF4114 domain-containing protein [Pacificimonas sp. WHA3]|uniref:DUF4114 domain-containing protein n=1 Tax=Pacificimonas pallii TaxID=2827236 RepID=A0ABS6SH88_9SPHN|nr:DUF4114 domain-containing protein [Pacificimonas pallii]MBV7257755.1 DUF4114 domain-containing protein [Pacificimonas pallii]